MTAALLTQIISGVTALSGLAAAAAAITTTRLELHKLSKESARTGVSSSNSRLALNLSMELSAAHAEINRMRAQGCT